MRILSIRKGFQGDHSSTSYEFYAIDNRLKTSQQAAVARLSSRARPTKRRVSFIYNGEWSDLPGGWEPLVEKYYDVMHTESYDWWTLALAFNTKPENISELEQYEFDGSDEMGVSVYAKGNRVVIAIACRMDYSVYGQDEYSDYDYDEEEDDDACEETGESDDYLLNLLAKNREYLKKGDYRLLYGAWQQYGPTDEDDEEFKEEEPPEPPEMDKLPQPIGTLLSLMEM